MKFFKILIVNFLLFLMFSTNVFADFTINIYIEKSNNTLSISAEPTDKIDDIKEIIEGLTGIDSEYQALFYKDNALISENTLQDSGISPNDANITLKVSPAYKVVLDVSLGNIVITSDYYQINDIRYQYTPDQYYITGSSSNANVDINDVNGINIVLDNLQLKFDVPWQACNNYVKLTNSFADITVNGNNIIQAHQDSQNAPAFIMDETSSVKINGNGNLTIHGGSNYHGGSAAIVGGNIEIESGTVNLIGGNKVENDYGKCFDGNSLTLSGGILNCYQGTIDSNSVGVIEADELNYDNGYLNEVLIGAKPSIGEYHIFDCNTIVFQAENNVYYKIDDGEWMHTSAISNLSVGNIYHIYKKYMIPSLNYTSDISDPFELVINHTYSNRLSDKLAKEATCTEPAEYYLLCDNCGKLGEETLAVGDALGHLLNDKWSYDISHHWKMCQRCQEKQESTYSDHQMVEVVAKQPTIYETGIKYQQCSICGYRTDDIIIPKQIININDTISGNETVFGEKLITEIPNKKEDKGSASLDINTEIDDGDKIKEDNQKEDSLISKEDVTEEAVNEHSQTSNTSWIILLLLIVLSLISFLYCCFKKKK